MKEFIQSVIDKYSKESSRLMDILHDIQIQYGFVPEEFIDLIAQEIGLSSVDVMQTISFYHFYSTTSRGRYTIYLNDSVVSKMKGMAEVAKAFEKAAGISFGSVTSDEQIGLFYTSCIGMNDQEPAAIINGKMFTNLTPYRAKHIIADIKSGMCIKELDIEGYGDGQNANDLVKSMVSNNIRKKGPILSANWKVGAALETAIAADPQVLIDTIKKSNIRGRGGAGFPTGLKWEFCRKSAETEKYVFCNADEGEPGTFKDRVIITEKPKLLFEGMALAAYAIGANLGILYLRQEYRYLNKYLENVLSEMREANVLGKNVCGKQGFDFDIRIQFGAGAYICGEESALIESAEGKRGEPRDRPPFPVEKGYMDKPTVVNNVETLCAVVNIVHKGSDWYKSLGTKDSTGTKILSISGDCMFPGIYEIEWGLSIAEMLEMIGAKDVQAVQVGGPSGALINPSEFNRVICYADMATGGSMIVFGKNRDLLKEVVLPFTEFFIEESCGSCSTCRNMTYILKTTLIKVIDGHGIKQDIDDLIKWSKYLKASRCGLGQTAANPIVTSIKNFRKIYDNKVQDQIEFYSGFNMASAVKESCAFVNRIPNIN